jgi:ubiquinone/menaquinone biosynthesis C-methylase UbiE
MLNENNHNVYSTSSIVRYYAQLQLLQPAEQTILDRLRTQRSPIRMLDMGVGGGRTTQHFAPVVDNYTGIDYSAEMIAACRQRFSDHSQTITFTVCDARDMSQFQDQTFDFILFSFNGIDYMPYGDREKVLQEVCRVGKAGGFFFFSSHNLQGMEREFHWQHQLRLNPFVTYVNLVMFAILRVCNRSMTLEKLCNADYLMLRDESHNFRLQTHYVRPRAQIAQLETYFSEVTVYSWSSGLELTPQEQRSNVDMWLYYLCKLGSTESARS